MSFYGLIVSAILLIVGNILNWVSSAIILASANQSSDQPTKSALKAAFWFSLLEIPFVLIVVIGGIKYLATRGCSKRHFVLLFSFILLVISFIIVFVITYIYAGKASARGDGDTARNLNSVRYLLIATFALSFIAFLIIYFIIGRKVGKIGKLCRKARKLENRVKGEARQVQAVEKKAVAEAKQVEKKAQTKKNARS